MTVSGKSPFGEIEPPTACKREQWLAPELGLLNDEEAAIVSTRREMTKSPNDLPPFRPLPDITIAENVSVSPEPLPVPTRDSTPLIEAEKTTQTTAPSPWEALRRVLRKAVRTRRSQCAGVKVWMAAELGRSPIILGVAHCQL